MRRQGEEIKTNRKGDKTKKGNEERGVEKRNKVK